MYKLQEIEKPAEISPNISGTVAPPEIRSLTAFRFITAFMVYFFHCSFHFGAVFPVDLVARFIRNGAVFMTGFFVLSDFIMSYVYEKTDFTCRKIY